ncbi:MAG: hypothetical protein JWN32_4061 [Solirubrobacterales bacterium]|nr:hypothetical protein [Solirubrobacterales bacterium]
MVIGAAFLVMLGGVDREREATALARHSEQVLVEAGRLHRLLLDLEMSQRDFSANGDTGSFARWQATRRAISATGASFVGLTKVPGHHAQARRIVAEVDSYVRDRAVPLMMETRSAWSAGRPRPPTDTDQRTQNSLRARFDRFTLAEESFVAGRGERAAREARMVKTVAIVGLAVSVPLIFLFAAYLVRAIVRPIRRAAAMAGQLATGDLSTRLPETSGHEIGALERAFNTMGRSLETSSDELRQLADEQAALRRVATLVAQGVPSTDLLTAVVGEVERLLGAHAVTLFRYEEDGTARVLLHSREWGAPLVGSTPPRDDASIPAMVHRTGRPARRDGVDGLSPELRELLLGLGVRSAVGAPIVVDGRLWGVIDGSWTDGVPGPDADERMAQFTELVATSIANAASRAELRASRARVVVTADETRRRIERDLHDGAQQRLVHAVVTLKLAKQTLQNGGGSAAELVDEALEHAELATNELRELVHGILPAALSRGGLRAGVATLLSRIPLEVSSDVTSERLAPVLEATAYFIVSEALTNVVKHAGASRAEVKAVVEGGALHVEVRDDGAGGARLDGSSGLLGLYDRAAAVDGELTVESPPNGGTVVAATLPISANDRAPGHRPRP